MQSEPASAVNSQSLVGPVGDHGPTGTRGPIGAAGIPVAGELRSFEPKFFLCSKTVLSGILLALPQILGGFGIAFSDADAQRWLQFVTTVLGILGVIYGRAKAIQPIHFGGAAAPLLGLAAILLFTGCLGSGVKLKLPKTKVTYHSEFGSVSYDGKTLTTDFNGGEVAPGLSVEGGGKF